MSLKYRAEIDGLRALAVVPVILFHAGFEIFSGGFVGVDVFFVISGYLITTIIINEMDEGKFTLVKFYERRARRILPALFFVMLVSLPFAWMWLMPRDMKDFAQSLVAVSTFSSNILFWRQSGYFDAAVELKPLLHTWSLAVEEQYYIIFPVFLIFTWKFGKNWMLAMLAIVFIVSLGVAQWGAYNKLSAAFYLLPTRGWELLVGVFSALYLQKQNVPLSLIWKNVGSAIGLLLITYSIFVYGKQTPYPGVYALAPTIGTALIIIFAANGTLINKFLSTRVFVGIGLISYSAYLWHQPLFAFARHRSIAEISPALMLVLSSATLPLAYLSWKYVESPFRNRRITFQQIGWSVSVFVMFFISLGLFGHISNGFSDRFNAGIYREITSVIDAGNGQLKCWGKLVSNPIIEAGCRLGTFQGDTDFVILGDSHAGALASGLDVVAREENLSGINITLSSCPPLIFGKNRRRNEEQNSCDALRTDFFSSLDTDRIPDNVILLSRWTIMIEQERFNNFEGGIESGDRAVWINEDRESEYAEAVKQNYISSINAILKSGRRVFLVYPVPEVGWDVPRYIIKRLLSINSYSVIDASTSWDVFLKRNERAIDALDAIGQHPNLVRVYPHKIFCNSYVVDRCVATDGDNLFYFDDDHLTAFGAALVARKIVNKINEFK